MSCPLKSEALHLHNLHTQEVFNGLHKDAKGHYISSHLKHINALLRDHRTQEIYPIQGTLLDLLDDIAYCLCPKNPDSISFDIISGYRSPKTNQILRRKNKSVSKSSLHMAGKAVDIRVPGVALKKLRDIAQSLKKGGVGYYPNSNFIHIDTGKIRYWTGS